MCLSSERVVDRANNVAFNQRFFYDVAVSNATPVGFVFDVLFIRCGKADHKAFGLKFAANWLSHNNNASVLFNDDEKPEGKFLDWLIVY